MNITDAYHIVLAIHTSQLGDHDSDIDDLLQGETETAWNSLSPTQQTSFKNFSQENADLFDSFPSSHQNAEDMEQREEAIKAIEEKLYSIFSFLE